MSTSRVSRGSTLRLQARLRTDGSGSLALSIPIHVDLLAIRAGLGDDTLSEADIEHAGLSI
jgi:hypothetical protein